MAAGRKKGRKKKNINRERRRNLMQLGCVLALAVLLVCGSQGMMRRYIRQHEGNQALSGVYVGNTEISGMSQSEALQAVKKEVSGYALEQIQFQITEDKVIEASLEELGLSALELEKTVAQAVQYGKSEKTVQAYKIIKKAEKNKLKQHFPIELAIDAEEAAKVLEKRAEGVLDTPENARLTHSENGIKIMEGKEGEGLEMEKTLERVNRFLNQEWDGKGGVIQAVVEKKEPEITGKDLESVTDLLGSHTTYYDENSGGRVRNVESGAMHLNGILLQPGDEQSANEAMEPYTEENGYAEAASYESNTVVQTMGGGICQVSTTLYNALLYAELEIVERYPHSMLVNYAEPSKDAAIADDVMDLVFKNNLDSPVYIEALWGEGTLTFNIYGKETRSPGRELAFISETTESKETEGKRFVATDDYIGYLGIQSYSHPEISAQLWKVVSENGVEVSRDVINYSQYVAAPETYGVGTASEDAAATEKMRNAILTQDEETIQSVMQEILYGPSIQEDTGQASVDLTDSYG